MADSSKNGRRVLQSIKRASDVLSVFITEDRELGLADFVRELKLSKSTLQGIIYSLEALGYLEQNPVTHKYRLGARLFQLGMKYATNLDLFSTAQVWLERLSYKYREPVNVGMLIDNKVVVVLRIDPEQKFISYPRVGSIIPVHTTCIGKVLLAWQSDARRREILRDCSFQKLTDNTIGSLKEFLRELDDVRDRGTSFDNQESAIGLAGIGAGVFNNEGNIVAAFALTGRAEHIFQERDEMTDAVTYTSRQVSRQLGYRGTEKDDSA